MKAAGNPGDRARVPGVSAVLPSGETVEMVYRPQDQASAFECWRDGASREVQWVDLPGGARLVPYSPRNNLVSHGVVLFPSAIEEYGSREALLSEVRAFIHRYVDLSPAFEEVAAHYVLFTWLYDDFDELPYLRVRGDVGSGKSRFLKTVGALCYKPIFASGASTVSPLFRLIDAIRGTLVLDESDFRWSDERAEIVKILNNGNARGFPVLRSEATPTKEFNPRAFAVFGPKLIATRHAFDDRALESRCITEEMGMRPLRGDLPFNLPETFDDEAQALRNRLLLFRFKCRTGGRSLAPLADRTLEPRISQIFAPFLSTVLEEGARERLRDLARVYSGALRADRSFGVEAAVLEAVRCIRSEGAELSLKAIAERVADAFGGERVTPRWVGTVLRKRLGVVPRKRHGNFVVDVADYPRLDRLAERYGGTRDSGDMGDVGDETGSEKPSTSGAEA